MNSQPPIEVRKINPLFCTGKTLSSSNRELSGTLFFFRLVFCELSYPRVIVMPFFFFYILELTRTPKPVRQVQRVLQRTITIGEGILMSKMDQMVSTSRALGTRVPSFFGTLHTTKNYVYTTSHIFLRSIWSAFRTSYHNVNETLV